MNGTYPTEPVGIRQLAAGALVVVPLSSVAALIGDRDLGAVGWLPAAALAVLLWKHLTVDYDAASDLGWQRRDRLATLVIGVGALLYAPLSLCAMVMVCGRLGGWTHHASASIRLVKASCAYSLAAGALDLVGGGCGRVSRAADALVIFGTVYLSHYVVAAYSKLKLGNKPWDWAARNRLDMLAASAYSWGWGRFVPKRWVTRLIAGVGAVTAGLNWGTMVVEGLGVVAYTNRWLLLAAVIGAVCFNLVVVLAAGLFFYENMLCGMVLVVVILRLPPDVASAAFGPVPWLTSLVLLILVLRGWAWQPTGLGWWDTPLTERVYFNATTSDDRSVGIRNTFMSPFDREYARAVGNALTAETFVTFPLGGVENAELRDGLLRLDDRPEELADLQARFGVCYWNPDIRARHEAYLTALFARLGSGVRKSPLPRRLRWLKAPSGHLYHGGELPRYRLADGPLSAIQGRFRRAYYSTTRQDWLVVRDEILFEIQLGQPSTPKA